MATKKRDTPNVPIITAVKGKRGFQPTGQNQKQVRAAIKQDKEKAKMGAPTKLTPEIENKIVQYIEVGNYAYIAAIASGISEKTFFNWMKAGEDENAPEPFRTFYERVKEAEAKTEIVTVGLIRNQVQDNWAAGMTWLERRFPKRWSRREQVEVSNSEEKPFQVETSQKVDMSSMSKEQVAMLAALARSFKAGKKDGQ